jgi:hypothetical protein
MKKHLAVLCMNVTFGSFCTIDAMQKLSSVCCRAQLNIDTGTSNRLNKVIELTKTKSLPVQIFNNTTLIATHEEQEKNCNLNITTFTILSKHYHEIQRKIFKYKFSAIMKKIPAAHFISYSADNYSDEYEKITQNFLNQKAIINKKDYTYGELMSQQSADNLKPLADRQLILARDKAKNEILGLILFKAENYCEPVLDISAFGTVQRQKIGKSLLEYVVNYHTKKEQTKLELATDKFNTPAQNAYKALKFQQEQCLAEEDEDESSPMNYFYLLKADRGKLFLPPHFDEIIQKYHEKLLILPTTKNEFSIVLPAMNSQENALQHLSMMSKRQKSQLTEEAQQTFGDTPAYFIATLPGLFLHHHITQVCRISS